jgi:transketolase
LLTYFLATHDSIGLGEDGPTHQPVETQIALRATPNLAFWRPADGNETSAAYRVALETNRTPSVLSLSRQNLPQLEGSTIDKAMLGGYVLVEQEKEDLTIVSTGSEVGIAVDAAKKLGEEGLKVRVVSLPCWLAFDQQPQDYRLSVLRSGAPILSVEAASTAGWAKYSHEQFGLPAWGASAPYERVYEEHGLTGKSKLIPESFESIADCYSQTLPASASRSSTFTRSVASPSFLLLRRLLPSFKWMNRRKRQNV